MIALAKDALRLHAVDEDAEPADDGLSNVDEEIEPVCRHPCTDDPGEGMTVGACICVSRREGAHSMFATAGPPDVAGFREFRFEE